MKDILIVLKPRVDGFLESYNTIKKEADKNKGSTKEVFETAFLITGPKSFEIAMSLYRLALEQGIPVAFFEIQSCLLMPNNHY